MKRSSAVRRWWIFPNPETCLRLVTALCVEQSEEWVSGRRYLDMAALTAHTGEPGPDCTGGA